MPISVESLEAAVQEALTSQVGPKEALKQILREGFEEIP